MKRKILTTISPGVIPLTLGTLFLILNLVSPYLGIPDISTLATKSKELFDSYGAITVIVAAFFEAFFMLSFYFPGSFVLLLSVIVSDKSALSLLNVGFYAWIGFMIAMILNYLIGRYGFYKYLLVLGKKDTIQSMQKWLNRHGKKAFFLAGFHPNFLSVAVVCAGIAHQRMVQTFVFSGLSLIFWISLWLIMATPFIQNVNVENENQSWYIIGIFYIWAIGAIVYRLIKDKRRLKVNK